MNNNNYYITSINSSVAYRFSCACHKSGVGYKQAQFNFGIFRREDAKLIGVCQLGGIKNNNISLSRFCFTEGERENFLELLKQKFPNNKINFTPSCEDNIASPKVEEYYDNSSQLFTRRTLIRRGEIIPDKHKYVMYNNKGKLEHVSNSIVDFHKLGYVPESITNALKTGKIYKDKFFRDYVNEDPREEIEFPYLCIIDNKYFFKQQEAGDYLKISKQAISAARSRGATIVGGKPVIWGKD